MSFFISIYIYIYVYRWIRQLPWILFLNYKLLRWKNIQEQEFSWNKLRHLEEKNNFLFGRLVDDGFPRPPPGFFLQRTGYNYQLEAEKQKIGFRNAATVV